MVTPMVRNVHPHLAVRQAGRNLPNEPPIGSISKRLDDMLSTPFCSHIIHYEPPRGFLVPKFSTYDGSSDPFDHIMHYRQLMTLDIGNDAPLCKNINTLQNIKMQDNESLREFVKRFGQAILQVEAYSMDAVLQIFKRSICLGTPFFESLAKKPPTIMNDLFRCANKYSMLEDDVRAATQQVLVVGQASRSGMERSAKLPDRPRPSDQRQERPSRPERPPPTPLSISYEKLLLMIQGLSDFRWPRPLGTDPSKRDHSKRCAFHKEHGHTTEICRCLHYLVEKLIKAGHLKQYLRLDAGETRNMQNALRQNHDIFAWAHSDMKGIHPSITSHRLNVLPTARSIQQRVRRFHPDRQKIIQDEIDKLLEAGFIKELDYPDWLGKWRVCVDYTNLNNACPKYSFPLLRIDQIVDSTVGQGMLSFLDAFSGYHQIPMSSVDEEKIAFITPHGLYCYRLNPSKCAFGVSAGKFLGFMVSQRGIEVSPDQVKSVMETPSPRSKKELQCLTGKLVALGSFIARFTNELRPFFLAIQKIGANGWTDNCQNAFKKIKQRLCNRPSPTLSLKKNCTCIRVSEWAIVTVLFRCPSSKEQKPIYYVSRALADVETRYSKMELTALALRSAAQKLRPYFQAHPVVVLTDQPLRNILHKPELTGRML
ncbi:hypothetical protein AAG906_039137 [Vitis piasezkii]